MLACSCLHHAMKRSGAATFIPGFCCCFRDNALHRPEVAGRLKADVRFWHLADIDADAEHVRF